MTDLDEMGLMRFLADCLDVDPSGVRIELCSTGKHNETYFVEADSRSLVLRIAPPDDPSRMLFYEYRMMHQEPELHTLRRERTEVPVPEILDFDTAQERIGRDFLLMERMPGTPLSDNPHLTASAFADVLRDVGQRLRQAHSITRDAYGYVGAHRPMEPQNDWASAFVVMWNKLLDDIQRCAGYSDEDATFMRRLLDSFVQVFEREVPACLLHMDVWAQNILADDDGCLTGLLDWDRALWGDPEIEFAVLDYCGISEPAFWQGYGAQRDRSPEAAIRRVFYLLYELQKYIFIRRVRRNRPEEGEQYRRHSLELAQSLSRFAAQ